MLVKELLSGLLEMFPLADAESWDHVGLSVGDPSAAVSGVCCALDASLANVRVAAERGANVLLTHHPVYISAPDAFTPAAPERSSSGAVIYEAARAGVSIISLHTNLDRSLAARKALPSMVGLKPVSSLEHASDPALTGLGALCDMESRLLLDFTRDLSCAFGTEPRIWGEPDTPLTRVAFLGGSLGSFGEYAIAAGAQAIVCGEAGYHVAQDLALRGCAVVLLGHDRSEEPFCRTLEQSAIACGVDPAVIDIIPGPRQWWTLSKGGRP